MAVAVAAAVPALLLDPDSSIYSHKMALYQGVTAAAAVMLGILSLIFLPTDPKHDARPQILLGGLVLTFLAFNNALILLDIQDARHSAAGIVAMVCAAVVYPRLFGVLLISFPQLGLLAWLATQSNWQSDWTFAFLATLGGVVTALLTFFLKQAYYRHHRTLLAERSSFIEALQRESAERTLLQEQILNERYLTTLGRLAGGVAHDLNNILVPIMGNAAMLEESVQNSSHKSQAREVMQAATRARNLTQQLGFFSSRNKDKYEILEINQLLSELCPIVWRTFPQGIDIDLQVHDKPIYLRASRVVLQDLFTNLLLDAGNAAPVDASVTVKVIPKAVLPDEFTAPPDRGFCAVSIQDGASALTADERTALFEPDQISDRGIGLLSARDKAEALGAHLSLHAAEDGSNQFCLFLPVQEPEKIEAPKVDSRISAAAAPEVLVVDDERSVRRVTSQLLTRAGFVVRECDSGEAALRELGTHLPDAIVMDLRMPGMGGRAATERIRKQNSSLPIVICSGYTGDAEGWLKELPNCALVQKPYDTQDLIKTVNSLLNSEFAAG